MVDIHTHCLPEIDDGAKDVEMSIAMLQESFLQGVTTCIATPHCIVHHNDDIAGFIEKRNESYNMLSKKLNKDTMPELLLGAEVYMDNDLSSYPDIAKLCIGNSSYMLIELAGTDPIHTAEWLYRLKLKKIQPIIAHIDRYKNFEKYLEEFSGLNLIYQINASRYLSISGRSIIKKILQYANHTIAASDMHNITTRPCNMKLAYEKSKKRFGGITDKMFKTT